jgi:hypothetical protein
MKAKEMFKERGYKFKESHSDISYMSDDNIAIIFYKSLTQYAVIDMELHGYCRNSVETHQAITQQMKELGWIK